MAIPYYLQVGKAEDLKDKKERMIYRFFEILPGVLVWTIFFFLIIISWLNPFVAAIIGIAFIVYWVLRIIYFSFHLLTSFKILKKNEKIDWLEKIKRIKNWDNIYHLVIVPAYREPFPIIKETINSLLNSDYPKEKMIVVLSCEEKNNESETIGRDIEKQFAGKFFKFLFTVHPKNLPGEIPGKGSNDAWATKTAKEKIIDPLSIPYKNIIVSSLDADTKVFEKYFSYLTFEFLTSEDPLHSSFQPIPLFLNNILEAPAISRIFAFSTTFWEMMCHERPEKLKTFSSHSAPFSALVDVGFRQKNVVSDDSRIFWQCFLKYDGNYKVVPLYYPISMDANCASSFLKTLKNIYLQQRRWAYGIADVPYYFFGFLKNRKIPASKFISLALTDFETFLSWSTAPIVIFFIGWLPNILGGNKFNQMLISYNLPLFASNVLTFLMVGLLFSSYLSIVLIQLKFNYLGRIRYFLLALEWLLLPFIMIFFSALPALEAQTRLMLGRYLGFYSTEKYRKND